MTSQKKILILTTHSLETRMYVETDVFWNIQPWGLMDRFLWNCGRCYTREEHNSNTQCCGSLESHKHMIVSDLSNVHNPYFDVQLTERRWHNSDKGLGQTRNHDRAQWWCTGNYRKISHWTFLPGHVLHCGTMTWGPHQVKCSMHWWTLSKSKSKTRTQKENLRH